MAPPPAQSPIEQVLAVPRHAFAPELLPHGVAYVSIEPYLDLIERAGGFVSRPDAEATTELKQIVPYVYLWHEGRIFLYRRRRGGTEAGLWDRTSVGFGGHVNPVDGAASPLDTVTGCARRELEEELGPGTTGSLRFLGVLNDDTDPVGARHLGLVLRLDLDQPAVRIRERAALARVGRGFFTRRGIARHLGTMESWSRLLVEAGGGRCFDATAGSRLP